MKPFLPTLYVAAVLCSHFPANVAHAQAAQWPDPLPVCDDGAEWAPFTYYLRDSSGVSTQKVVGYSVEVLTRILEPLGKKARIELLPWARCQLEVAMGQNFALALNASPSPERAERFLMSRPYYRTHHAYFYSRRHHPGGLNISDVSDLNQYRVCGVHGYNYSDYKLLPHKLDTGAQDLTRVIAKLHMGRCDLGLEKWEILVGTRNTGQNLLADPELVVHTLPGLPITQFHMLISRRYPELAQTINKGLENLEASGELAVILTRYIPPPSANQRPRFGKGAN